MTRTLLNRLLEIRRLQGILSQQSFEPEQIFGDVHRRRLVVAAKELGEDSVQLIKGVAAQIVRLPGFKGAPAEKVYEAVAAKMEQLEAQLAKERSKISSASGGDGEPPGSQSTAADVGDQGPPVEPGGAASQSVARIGQPEPQDLTSEDEVGSAQQLESLRRALNAAIAEANQVDRDDMELCVLASRKLVKASVDLETQLNQNPAAGEAVTGPCMVDLSRAVPLRDEIGHAIKLLKRKQAVVAFRMVEQAVTRARTAAREALRGEDPDEMDGVHQQLSKRVEEMESTAASIDGELSSKANELLRESEGTLQKLWKKKQEIERGHRADRGSSSGDQSPQNRRSDFTLPAGVQLTGNTVSDLLSVLARGHSKLPTPSWPKFNDSYRSYYVFKEELSAYIKDYGHGIGKRSLAEQIKKHCLSKGTADYLEFTDLPKEILET
jgi:hypothetical protein